MRVVSRELRIQLEFLGDELEVLARMLVAAERALRSELDSRRKTKSSEAEIAAARDALEEAVAIRKRLDACFAPVPQHAMNLVEIELAEERARRTPEEEPS